MASSDHRSGGDVTRRRSRKMIAVSAGGVVWREADQPGEVEVVLVQTPAMRWALPKGKPENGERLTDTALREVAEETGLKVALDEKIGVMRYSFSAADGRIDKAVHFWLMQATGGSFEDHDNEHIDVRWVGLGDAMRMVAYRNTASLLEDAAAMLDARVRPPSDWDAPPGGQQPLTC